MLVKNTKLANMAIPIYHYCATDALLAIYIFIRRSSHGLVYMWGVVFLITSFLFFIIDSLVLQARVRFPPAYILVTITMMTVLVFIVNIIWIVAGESEIFWFTAPITVLFATIAGSLICAINRIDITKCCDRKNNLALYALSNLHWFFDIDGDAAINYHMLCVKGA